MDILKKLLRNPSAVVGLGILLMLVVSKYCRPLYSAVSI